MSFFSFFKSKKDHKSTSTDKVIPKKTNSDINDFERIENQVYTGIAIYVRDVNLTNELADKYVSGLIIREKAFTDASNRVMGMTTSHRYMILSNHMTNFSLFEQGTNWGLHIAKKDSRFKVLGKHTYNGKTAIVLLHLPDNDNWKVYKNCQFPLDEELYQSSIKRFEIKCEMAPIPELSTPEWLNRCKFPVGMDDNGNFWSLE